jgi:hypothetical protein
MAFVPPATYVPPPRASLEAQDLARELEEVVVEFQKRRPQTSNRDIRQALDIVDSRGGLGGSSRRPQTAIMMVLGGLLAAFALSLLFFLAR